MKGMQTYNWDSIEKERMNPFLVRQVIHGDNMTIARLELGKGASVPQHSHHNEQVSMVAVRPHPVQYRWHRNHARRRRNVRIPPNVPHFVEVMEDCVVFDLFSPRREDWIRGDDAYLRSK